MPDDENLSRRLKRLEAYVAVKPAHRDATSTSSSDLAEWHMRSVTLDRIAHLTMELQQRGDSINDSLDALEMRLLLNDYTDSVSHLRAVTLIAKQGIRTAAAALKGVRAVIEREQREEERRLSSGDR